MDNSTNQAISDFDRPTVEYLPRHIGVDRFCTKWLGRVDDWDDDQGLRVPASICVGLIRLAKWAER